MFISSNKLEQLEFKLEKLLGFRNMQEKLENVITYQHYQCSRHAPHPIQVHSLLVVGPQKQMEN